MEDNNKLGHLIRRFRQEKSLTVHQLAEEAGLSAPYVSQLEHDKASPSIATLRRIANALDVHIVEFFADDIIKDPIILPKDKWTQIILPRWDADVHQLVHSVENKKMQPFYTIVPPGGGSESEYAHAGEEFGIVVKGQLTLYLGSDVYTLHENTACYFSSLRPHSWKNLTNEPVHLIWVLTPPSW
ncbi:helix-turn-helix domain-containing protein [Desulforhopalus singaporensis]|uniref:Helix-turn-helix n=1 Tax=Desulforhopalus singaporensis TaxID=91360 RepID=A0A1H0N687_9BACT|nr:XRE family transcriptional regulator [Desulforhopalus singaporensis]SDO88141.1 Helix-turn-helix [Desulforhopalus singaporensis]